MLSRSQAYGRQDHVVAMAKAGATWIDASVLGIGDRGGCVALEEAAALFEMYGADTGIKLEALYELCCYVRELLHKWNLKFDNDELQTILFRARAAVASNYGRHYLTFDEFRKICDGVLNKSETRR